MAHKADLFHSHLDLCSRCRNQPFNLCAVGAMLLRASLSEDEQEFVETLRRQPTQRAGKP